jgi:hypothetical protein
LRLAIGISPFGFGLKGELLGGGLNRRLFEKHFNVASLSTCRGSKGHLSPKAAIEMHRLSATSAWPGSLKVKAGSGDDGVEGNMGFHFPWG